MPRDSSPTASRSFVTSELIAPSVVATRMAGHISEQLANDGYAHFVSLLPPGGFVTWVMDISRVQGFDARTVRAGARWYDAYKAAGGSLVICIAQKAAGRMAARALGFGAGLEVQVVDSLHEAVNSLGLVEYA